MSLADELLADLGGDGGVEDDANVQVREITGDEPMDTGESADGPDDIYKIARLSKSPELAEVMDRIHNGPRNSARTEGTGPMEADPEYQLIVKANQLAVEIDNELNIIHKYVRDRYSKRFPELENLIQMPLEYVRAVRALGNDVDRAKQNEELAKILSPATIMIVSVTASTTTGECLSENELQSIKEACTIAEKLNRDKLTIYEYVESRMSFIAPNLSIIVGSSVAAKLMGIAGGLRNLSNMPSCNIELLGAKKRGLSGFSQATIIPHTGVIYYSDLVQELPKDLRKRTARLIAGKCALAARVDAFHEAPDGSIGLGLREEIDKKMDKMQEPPPVKQIKALPVPLDAPRKKRGGRRARKMKERLGMTDMRKAANRVTFAEIEEDAYQDSVGYSVGQLGKAVGGRIRGPQVDNKTQVRISKTLQKSLQTHQTYGGTTTVRRQVAGTASSVAFTPYQGIEIVNPQAAERSGTATTNKYFASTSKFIQVTKTPVQENK
ncbi:U4/U6 small nuclear ribonucleoprotein Prp31-like [Paramacrobiotus metropolitanus]|uniref:U4/U6 small nuclear ribonucleoprotein Prp31-like n=1 Tax=Paramacrobiotus metropolitanus TaxID=2943436 RepID=UPI0024458F35|nr:U4/U6 small nuclear ribonucleoprotein Prp31-like [Paramacrobiotus metropolitanus]